MSHTLTFVPAKASHVRIIAGKLREIDRKTARAAGDKSDLAAVARTFRQSSTRMTALLDGVPVAMFGVIDINVLTGVGAPWLIPCTDIDTATTSFVRNTKPWLKVIYRRYSQFLGVVDLENYQALRWLRWLGVTFTQRFEHNGRDFLRFERKAD